MIGGLLILLGLTGCNTRPECDAATPCPFGAACVENVCVERFCATSAQCGMEQHCASGRCVDGCAETSDCFAGSSCDGGQCVKAACVDAHQDCAFKQFCNQATGECYEAGGYYCKPCGSDADCGGGQNLCVSGGYCGAYCRDGADCPAAFDCMPYVDINGNIVSYQCLANCELYEDFDPNDFEG